jgi:hypothetical protein
MKRIRAGLLGFCLCLAWLPLSAASDGINDVALDRQAFNPSLGEAVTLYYRLTQPASVTTQVFDADGGMVRLLENAVQRDAGLHAVAWNGIDDESEPVPDEAYTFTIETDDGTVYDPTTFSGGIVADADDPVFEPGGNLLYKLPAAARVLVRLGIDGGPMLNTLVDWEPRVRGTITESWDGRDADGHIDLLGQDGFTALVTYVTLPEATVITYGNAQESYRQYKLGRGQQRPQKPQRERLAESAPGLRPAMLVPPAWSRAPRVTMTFPNLPDAAADAVPTVSNAVDVYIDVDPDDRTRLLEDQFEVILFVDNLFFAEAERGHLPMNWRWELHQFPAGERLLTVNIASFRGQVGVVSRKVRLVK